MAVLYYTNGIAPVNALQLTYSNIRGNTIVFERQKTKKSNSEAKQINAFFHPEAKRILECWGNQDTKHSYLFPVLRKGMTDKEKVVAIDAFKRLTNRVLNRIGEKLQLSRQLNLYSARHTWATVMKLYDIPVAHISDGLGHANVQITSNYLGTIVTNKIQHMSSLL